MKKIAILLCVLVVLVSGCKKKNFSEMDKDEQLEYLEEKFDSGD